MSLSVLILNNHQAWEAVLKQIGIAFDVFKKPEFVNKEKAACLLIHSGSNSITKEGLVDFLSHGGTALIESKKAADLLNIKTKKVYVKYLYSDSAEYFQTIFYAELFDNIIISRSSNFLENQNNQKIIEIKKVGNGHAIIFPNGLLDLIYNREVKRKNFPSNWSNRYTTERASKVTKGKITVLVRALMEKLFHLNNLPLVTLQNFPGKENIFCFRIDTDFGAEKDIVDLYEVINKNKIAASWFIETNSAQTKLPVFNKMKDQEIALHCFRHKIFNGYDDNKNDIKKSLEILSRINIRPKGYAAPYGEWNKNSARVINEYKFNYSSEFCYAYDSLPIYPIIETDLSDVLQLPIHPVSVGRLHWGGHSEASMIKYYGDIIGQKIFYDEPVFLYTHPAEKRFNIFNTIFETIREKNIKNISMNEFAVWWKKRIEYTWNADFSDGKVKFNSENYLNEISYKIVYPDKNVEMVLSNGERLVLIKGNDYLKYFHKIDPDIQSKTTFKMIKHDILSKVRKYKQ